MKQIIRIFQNVTTSRENNQPINMKFLLLCWAGAKYSSTKLNFSHIFVHRAIFTPVRRKQVKFLKPYQNSPVSSSRQFTSLAEKMTEVQRTESEKENTKVRKCQKDKFVCQRMPHMFPRPKVSSK